MCANKMKRIAENMNRISCAVRISVFFSMPSAASGAGAALYGVPKFPTKRLKSNSNNNAGSHLAMCD